MYVVSDSIVPTQSLSVPFGEVCHPLHTAVVQRSSQTCVAQAAVIDQPLVMLFEGTIDGVRCCTLLDSGASTNFISDADIERLRLVMAPTQASLELADGNILPILGRVKVKLKMGAFHSHQLCYVTKLADPFDLILSDGFLTEHNAVTHFSEKVCTLTRHGKPYSLRPTQFVPPPDSTDTDQIDLNAVAVSASASIDKHVLSVTVNVR